MNRTIRNLIVALPLATAALAMTPGVAQADGPVIVLPPPGGDPQGPVIANPTPTDNPTHPAGPGNLTAPQPCPTHGVICGGTDGGNGGNNGGDNGGSDSGRNDHVGHHAGHAITSVALPTRIDAGLAPASQQADPNGLELSWLLASGVLVTASGAAFTARTRARSRA
jgi:hypothetical protein